MYSIEFNDIVTLYYIVYAFVVYNVGFYWQLLSTCRDKNFTAVATFFIGLLKLVVTCLHCIFYIKLCSILILEACNTALYSDTSANEDNSFRNHIR